MEKTPVTPIDPTFEDRKKQFLERYEALVKELEVDVGSAPQYFAIGGGAFATMMMKEVVDLKGQGVKSPFLTEKDGLK